MKQGALRLIAPESRPKYRTHVQAGMALYMDQVLGLREPKGAYVSHYLESDERSSDTRRPIICRPSEHHSYLPKELCP